jgi:hypothetical protein
MLQGKAACYYWGQISEDSFDLKFLIDKAIYDILNMHWEFFNL